MQIQARFGAKLELKLQIKTNRNPRMKLTEMKWRKLNNALCIRQVNNSPIFSEINNKSINYNKSTNEIELKTFNSFLVWFGWLIVDFIGELAGTDSNLYLWSWVVWKLNGHGKSYFVNKDKNIDYVAYRATWAKIYRILFTTDPTWLLL